MLFSHCFQIKQFPFSTFLLQDLELAITRGEKFISCTKAAEPAKVRIGSIHTKFIFWKPFA